MGGDDSSGIHSEPRIDDIENRWVALVAGETSRAETHRWASLWVEGDSARLSPLVSLALHALHGFDLTVEGNEGILQHGGPGAYLYSLEEIASRLDSWRRECVEYTRDPQSWLERRLRLAREEADRERQRKPESGTT